MAFGFGLFGAFGAWCIGAFAGDAGNFDRGPSVSNVTAGTQENEVGGSLGSASGRRCASTHSQRSRGHWFCWMAGLIGFGFGLLGACGAIGTNVFAGEAGNFDDFGRRPFAPNMTEGFVTMPLDACGRDPLRGLLCAHMLDHGGRAQPFGADAYRLAPYAAVRVGEASHPGPGGLRTTDRKRKNIRMG